MGGGISSPNLQNYLTLYSSFFGKRTIRLVNIPHLHNVKFLLFMFYLKNDDSIIGFVVCGINISIVYISGNVSARVPSRCHGALLVELPQVCGRRGGGGVGST